MLQTATHILYYIPSYRTFLSGVIECAYFLGHQGWQITICVPTEAECLPRQEDGGGDESRSVAVQRRNEGYRMAFAYLKDMARRRNCRVFRK